jgi:hypothetical protein
MSSYRTIHREQIFADNNGDTAIWNVHMTTARGGDDNTHWRILVGSSDGYLRLYQVNEKQTTKGASAELDASALQMKCTHTFLGTTQTQLAPAVSSSSDAAPTMLGCTQVSTVRNYLGEDDTAGDIIVASMDLGGTVRLWSFDQHWEEKTTTMTNSNSTPTSSSVRCQAEFVVANATGTTLALASPRIIKRNDSVLMAVGCLNGSISLISTGITVPSATSTKILEAGTVVE